MIGQSALPTDPVDPATSDGDRIAPDITPDRAAPAPKEIGGRDGPEPTRFGDWEKNGRCIDF
jgi:hypothetical protein